MRVLSMSVNVHDFKVLDAELAGASEVVLIDLRSDWIEEKNGRPVEGHGLILHHPNLEKGRLARADPKLLEQIKAARPLEDPDFDGAKHFLSGYVDPLAKEPTQKYWGAFEPNPWQSDDAVRAPLAMRRALQAYNVELTAGGLPPLAIGIGLHRGVVLAGLVGARERMEYACIGRTVNVAARVQALTRVHEADILITEAVRERLDPAFALDARPAAPIKGIAEPIVTFAVV